MQRAIGGGSRTPQKRVDLSQPSGTPQAIAMPLVSLRGDSRPFPGARSIIRQGSPARASFVPLRTIPDVLPDGLRVSNFRISQGCGVHSCDRYASATASRRGPRSTWFQSEGIPVVGSMDEPPPQRKPVSTAIRPQRAFISGVTWNRGDPPMRISAPVAGQVRCVLRSFDRAVGLPALVRADWAASVR